MLKRLADLPPASIEYEREKSLAAKRLGFSAAAVDRLVRALRPARRRRRTLEARVVP